MATGLCFVIMGILVLFYPRILVVLLASILIFVGIGIMLVSWQFRRLHRHADSRFMNWIIRF